MGYLRPNHNAPCYWDSRKYLFIQTDITRLGPHLQALSVALANEYRKCGEMGQRAQRNRQHEEATNMFERCRSVVHEAGTNLNAISQSWLLVWAEVPLVLLYCVNLQRSQKGWEILMEMVKHFDSQIEGDQRPLRDSGSMLYYLILYGKSRLARAKPKDHRGGEDPTVVQKVEDRSIQFYLDKYRENSVKLQDEDEARAKMSWLLHVIHEAEDYVEIALFWIREHNRHRKGSKEVWHDGYASEALLYERLHDYENAVRIFSEFGGKTYLESDSSTLTYRGSPMKYFDSDVDSSRYEKVVGILKRANLCRCLATCYQELKVKALADAAAAEERKSGLEIDSCDASRVEDDIEDFIAKANGYGERQKMIMAYDWGIKVNRTHEMLLFNSINGPSLLNELNFERRLSTLTSDESLDSLNDEDLKATMAFYERGLLTWTSDESLDSLNDEILKETVALIGTEEWALGCVPPPVLEKFEKLFEATRRQTESAHQIFHASWSTEIFYENDMKNLLVREGSICYVIGNAYNRKFLDSLKSANTGAGRLSVEQASFFQRAEYHLILSIQNLGKYHGSYHREAQSLKALTNMYMTILDLIDDESTSAELLSQLREGPYTDLSAKLKFYCKKAISSGSKLLHEREKEYSEHWESVELSKHEHWYSIIQRCLYAEINQEPLNSVLVSSCSREALLWAERNRTRALIYKIERTRGNTKFDEDDDIAWETIKSSRQAKNQTDTVLVEYSKSHPDSQNYYVYVVTKENEVIMEKIIVPHSFVFYETCKGKVKETLNEALRRLRSLVDIGSLEDCNETEVHEILICLHTLLINPIISHLPTNPQAKVIFSPCELLATVPFGALLNPDMPENAFMVQRHTIGLTPSFRALNWCENRVKELQLVDLIPGEGAVVAIGDPEYMPRGEWDKLSKSADEVETLAKLFPTRVAKLQGDEITPRDVLKWAKYPIERKQGQALFHIAAHGKLDSEEFKQGALIFSKPGRGTIFHFGHNSQLVWMQVGDRTGNRKDRYDDMELFLRSLSQMPGTAPYHAREHLSTEDIINCGFRWSAQIVVLSACGTANGEITSEGVLNLPRAFMIKGVPSVVVSQWTVDDNATSDLMKYFYTHLHKPNIDVSTALRLAMCQMIDDKVKRSKVQQWAPFLVWGSPSVCIPESLKFRDGEMVSEDKRKSKGKGKMDDAGEIDQLIPLMKLWNYSTCEG